MTTQRELINLSRRPAPALTIGAGPNTGFHQMTASGKETEEWRLGVEPGGHEAPEAPQEPDAPRNHSAERLERPLCIVTAEHLGWATVGVVALASRLVMLGARPLDSAEAGHALAELALLRGGPPAGAHLSWIHLLEAAVFAAVGAGDFGARLVFALSGLLLIAAGFAMRRQLGRAGAMAFAALLVLSPSVAYFSRAADSVEPALAFAVLALALFLQLIDEPGRLLAAALGVAVGLSLASGETALMTALFMLAALAIVGVIAALAGARVRLQVRVWWTRRKALFLIAVLVAALVWLGCESGFFTRSPLGAIAAAFRSNLPNLQPAADRGFLAGLDFYLPILSLYEFLVVLLAAIGALGVLTLRIRSRMATGALVWSALAVAFYLWTPARSPAFVLQMIVPMALLGALVIESLHHTFAWSIIRYPLARAGAAGALAYRWRTISSGMRPTPARLRGRARRCCIGPIPRPRRRHGSSARESPPRRRRTGRSAFFAADSPVLRWYLRALTPAATSEGATAIVSSVEAANLSEAQGFTTYEFELSDAWHPSWRSLTPPAALHYMASALAWAPLDSRRITVAVRPVVKVAPTVILAPAPAPTPTAAESAAPAEESTPEPVAPETAAPMPQHGSIRNAVRNGYSGTRRGAGTRSVGNSFSNSFSESFGKSS